ncbi:hypothetical protein CIHG_10376 [Coccidioides immitis H538.4]|uniref:Uncharacterized protein n=3 Tax=Coccidioides immitis TaxID=5501 RepID=A0A0J8QP06_COCIT|nr:hypothetical protein CIRG_05149 [Coccidioides immitis RMSCC 2394]KMU74196.1 hypothetical protein CISG_10296 [Coccidioides immitis RMSCC 3703]KMU92586.1 hypothetical protein CIHG_10376 [Coccidioides immitis H538.4]
MQFSGDYLKTKLSKWFLRWGPRGRKHTQNSSPIPQYPYLKNGTEAQLAARRKHGSGDRLILALSNNPSSKDLMHCISPSPQNWQKQTEPGKASSRARRIPTICHSLGEVSSDEKNDENVLEKEASIQSITGLQSSPLGKRRHPLPSRFPKSLQGGQAHYFRHVTSRSPEDGLNGSSP